MIPIQLFQACATAIPTLSIAYAITLTRLHEKATEGTEKLLIAMNRSVIAVFIVLGEAKCLEGIVFPKEKEIEKNAIIVVAIVIGLVCAVSLDALWQAFRPTPAHGQPEVTNFQGDLMGRYQDESFMARYCRDAVARISTPSSLAILDTFWTVLGVVVGLYVSLQMFGSTHP